MKADLKEIQWPINGHAPGNYTCHCTLCDTYFQGDKRAVVCKSCALEEYVKYLLKEKEEFELKIKQYQSIAELMKTYQDFGMYDATEDEVRCGDCGKPLTLVRPGKHQCDNASCNSFQDL